MGGWGGFPMTQYKNSETNSAGLKKSGGGGGVLCERPLKLCIRVMRIMPGAIVGGDGGWADR